MMCSINSESKNPNSTESPVPVSHWDDIIEIHDPEINVSEILDQIRKNRENRKSELQPLQKIALSEERLALRAAHESLRVKISVYGSIGEPVGGLKGKIQHFIKRVIRKLMKRHIDQERDVQEALLKLIERLIPYLDQVQYGSECFRRIEKIEEIIKKP